MQPVLHDWQQLLESLPADHSARQTVPATRAATEPDRSGPKALLAELTVLRQRIEARAYEKWVCRGCLPGTQLQDWAEAEAELMAEVSLHQRFADFGAAVARRERALRQRDAEHAITRALASSTDLDAAAPNCVRELAEALGWEVGVFWRLEPRERLLRCAVFWRAVGVEVPQFEALTRQLTFGPGQGLPGRVWASGEPMCLADLAGVCDLARASLAEREGLHGACAFPVRSGNALRGVLEFFSRDVRPPDEEDLQMAASIGSQLSQFIDWRMAEEALRAQEEERRLARTIQQGFLPQTAPALPGFRMAGASRPAQMVGGDYYDFIPLPSGDLGLALGDVSGHGVGAALLMGQVRACLRALALTHNDVGLILSLANRRLAEDIACDLFVTLFLARLDPRERTLVHGNAGHWPGYVLDAHGELRATLPSTALPLGLDDSTVFPVGAPLTLESGDLVLLLTDGIIEACPPEGPSFGMPRALDVVRAHRRDTPEEVLEALFQALREYTVNCTRDDMTAVVLKVE